MPTDDGEERNKRRKEALDALTWVWAHLKGERRSAVTDAHYRWVYDCCLRHLTARWSEKIHLTTVQTVVDVCLIEFLPHCHVRHIAQVDPPGPDDVLRAMDNACLDWLADQTGRLTPISHLPPSTWRTDDDAVSSLFGVEFDAISYQEAMHMVHVDGARDEFLVVTQFIDMWQVSNRVREEDVAARLEMDVSEIRPLLYRFVRRMSDGGRDAA